MTDLDDIKQAVHAALDERDGLDRERHRADHDWVYERRQREMRRAQQRDEMRDKIKAMVIGGMALSMLTAVSLGLYNVGRFIIDLYQKSQGPH